MEWIDINKEKPTNGEQCLVYYIQRNGREVYDMDFYDAEKLIDFYNNRDCVSHWMRLEQPQNCEIEKRLQNDQTIDSVDKIMKISIRIMDKFRDELLAEYGTDAKSINKMFNTLYEEQAQIMPLPWYEYVFAFKDSNVNE